MLACVRQSVVIRVTAKSDCMFRVMRLVAPRRRFLPYNSSEVRGLPGITKRGAPRPGGHSERTEYVKERPLLS